MTASKEHRSREDVARDLDQMLSLARIFDAAYLTVRFDGDSTTVLHTLGLLVRPVRDHAAEHHTVASKRARRRRSSASIHVLMASFRRSGRCQPRHGFRMASGRTSPPCQRMPRLIHGDRPELRQPTRIRLPNFPSISELPARVTVAFGGATHVGRVRENNEDQYLIAKLAKSMRICFSSLDESETTRFSDEEGYLMIVADGMGGMAGGQEASAMAVRTVESFVLDAIKWFLHREGNEQDTLLAELRQALQRADHEIVERADLEPRLNGMGTTLTMSYSVGTDLFVAHAGDSRAYLLRDGQLERVTSDHTLVQLLVDHGAITPEDARAHPRRHVITNVVGGPSAGVHVEIHRRSPGRRRHPAALHRRPDR